MFDGNILNPMLTGDELVKTMRVIPEYDDSIITKEKSCRLVALSELYNVYLPSVMSEEIYSKIYLSILRSFRKKQGIIAVEQYNQNYRRVKGMTYQGIVGGSDSFTIIGSSGIGKSSAISRALDIILSDSFVEFENAKVCSAVVVQCPFDSSVKGLALEILRKIDDVLETKYYTNALRSHATTDVLIGIISQVALNHIGLLIIDEIQNVATSKNGKIFIHSVTQLINNSGISICMVGTPECKVFFEQKLQLARRSMGLCYHPLKLNDYFIDLCKTIFEYQYTQQKTVLTESLTEWLYEHSGGLVSVVISLLHDAQEIAILSEREIIDIISLEDAYEKRISMLHSFIKPSKVVNPRTTRVTKKNGQDIVEKIPAPENGIEPLKDTKMIQQYSIVEIVDQAKNNDFDVCEVLRQYCVVETISKDGIEIC